MKKVLALILILGMASLANATVIDVVALGPGSLGHAGTSLDPLEPSETIEIAIVLNHNPYAGWTSYDGYALSSMDLDLHVSGPGTLAPGTTNKSGDPLWQYDSGFSAFAVVDPAGADNPPYAEIGNGLDQILGVASPPIKGVGAPTVLMWDLILHCDDWGPVTIDLTMNGLTEYAAYTDASGNNPYPGGWLTMEEGDLGDLVIHQIPEPMTIALLGLGGLFLRRRK